MKLSVNNPIWQEIYHNLQLNWCRNSIRVTSSGWDQAVAEYGITVHRDLDKRVEYVMLPTDPEELTIFLLRWA